MNYSQFTRFLQLCIIYESDFSNRYMYPPYPFLIISPLGMNSSEAEFVQKRRPPSSIGPSSKTCPTCPPSLRISVRVVESELSSCIVTESSSIVLQKLGQPVPESYLWVLEKSGLPVTTSTYIPSTLLSQ